MKEALNSFPNSQLHLRVLRLGEIAKGINLLPDGQRRNELAVWLGQLMDVPATPLLPITREIPIVSGRETARSRRRGHSGHPVDLLLAATALVHSLTVCRRNTSYFATTGVALYDPWQSP